MKQELEARFDVKDILPLALIIVTAGIGLVYGLDILGDTRDDQGTCKAGFTFDEDVDNCYNTTNASQPNIDPLGTYDWNASTDTLTGISNFPEKLPIIVTVIVAAILIGILIRYMMVQ